VQDKMVNALGVAWGEIKHVFQLKNFNISTTKTKYINMTPIQS
jgi:hypothetical protein